MYYVNLPEEKPRRLSFYLAMEEYIARNFSLGDCFFMWQVEPSVIFGRNQLIENEVNLDFCSRYHIATYRRKSGGGCVYADMNNVMLSFITQGMDTASAFRKFLDMLVAVLRGIGIDASVSGRNDILVGGKKVSGSAFYHLAGHSIVHSTLLYDTDMINMVGSITPTDAKLLCKGVESVRQRITLLKNYTDLSLNKIMQLIRIALCEDEIRMSKADVENIEKLEKEYLSPEFITGHNPRYTIIRRHRIDNVGEFEVRIELKNERIKSVDMKGDYFLVGDLDALLGRLKNVPLVAEAVSEVIPDRVDDVILNMQREDLINILLT